MRNISMAIMLFLPVLVIYGCRKMIMVESPKNQLTTDKVFADSTSASAALLSVYTNFESQFEPNYSTYMNLYTDEMGYVGIDVTNSEYYTGRLTSGNATNKNTWSYLFTIIYQCNDILSQLQNNRSLSKSLVKQLSGEARFLRAFAYFYLVNLYGDVPLLLQTDVEFTRKAKRDDQALVYTQMIKDLTESKNELSSSYIGAGKVRANKLAASALLSRIFLYQKNWSMAEKEADAVIESNLYTPLEVLGNVFKANNREAILQFWNENGFIRNSSSIFNPSSTGVPQYIITTDLYNAFEMGDMRKSNWVGLKNVITGGVGKICYYNLKYKNKTANTSNPEYLVVMRIAEQFLIRAEARAMLGNIKGAVDDLNVIRKRAGLSPLSDSLHIQECLSAIAKERRVELFTENGQRFFDLKRSGQLNTVMGNYKPGWENGTSSLLPVPQDEITNNRNLLQNPGY
ncbi:RagB/SusD family nutrient uptake outer membrane protein [Pedobacter sp. NJ-S-72]